MQVRDGVGKGNSGRESNANVEGCMLIFQSVEENLMDSRMTKINFEKDRLISEEYSA